MSIQASNATAKNVEIAQEKARPLYEVATISDMCIDLIVRGNVRPQFSQKEQLVDGCFLDLGGSANIFACQMARLGLHTAVIGYVGTDMLGDFALKRLKEAGVDVTLVKRSSSVQTGLGVTLVEANDRAILTFPGTIDSCGSADLPASPRDFCRHWHLASPFLLRNLRLAWRDFLLRAKAEGVTVSFDPNWDPDEEWHWIKELLPLVDVFLPNDAEAMALTGLTDPDEAAHQLAQNGPMVVVKRGARGALAVRGDRVWEVPTSELMPLAGSPVDTVGAGDNFDAGFIKGWLSGMDVDECLRLGHLCAVSSLSAAGGIAGQWIDPSRMAKKSRNAQ